MSQTQAMLSFQHDRKSGKILSPYAPSQVTSPSFQCVPVRMFAPHARRIFLILAHLSSCVLPIQVNDTFDDAMKFLEKELANEQQALKRRRLENNIHVGPSSSHGISFTPVCIASQPSKFVNPSMSASSSALHALADPFGPTLESPLDDYTNAHEQQRKRNPVAPQPFGNPRQRSHNAAPAAPFSVTSCPVPVPTGTGTIGEGSSSREPRKRAQLDAETVLRIYACKDDTSSCNAWAAREGVTPKAVRDIWNLRTWRQ